MEEKELLDGFLSKTLNMDEAGVASLYNDDGKLKDNALTILLDKDKERVKELKKSEGNRFDDGYKKAQSEILSKFEDDLKATFNFSSDKKGIELIREYVELTLESSGKKTKATEEDILRHPTYIKLKDDYEKAEKKFKDDYDQKLEDFKKSVDKEKKDGKVLEKALSLLDSLKPMLSKNPEVAANQKQFFLRELEKIEDWEEMDGDFVPIKDGKPLQDEHGKRIKFDQLIKSAASKYYDFNDDDDRDSPGPNDPPAPKKHSFKKPESEDEYLKGVEQINTDKTLNEKEKKEKFIEYTKLFQGKESLLSN